MIRSVIMVALFALGSCGGGGGGPDRDPDVRDESACANFTGCGECGGQPQCGWCITDGVGRCIANAGETERSTVPSECAGTWHWRIPDDPALPAGEPPYCPEVASAGDEAEIEAGGEEAP